MFLRRRAILFAAAPRTASVLAATSHPIAGLSAHPPRPLGREQPARWLSNEWGKLPSSTPPARQWSSEGVEDIVESLKANKSSGGNAEMQLDGKLHDVYLIDVREKRELVKTGKIPGAINIPMSKAVEGRGCWRIPDKAFEETYGFARPPRDSHVVFYCRAGVRAHAAAVMAFESGWKSVGEYPGSWLDWSTTGSGVEKVYTDMADPDKTWRPFVDREGDGDGTTEGPDVEGDPRAG
ncbi:Rhodanese-like protein [Ophiocordyceps camponoti-floridani]|uniref:Rhodanese-like protein n=1 Tax=Ophiocordyceps camponoti-floridani TaxID=2030778 RepID=A0A8H4Q6J6_9HYPO|nr:Rhodanese-like protein [Ophiocordyceps camponoti-floridani]